MSKQLGNDIELALSDEETVERVMTAVTDPARCYRNDPGHPEICNIYRLHGYFSPLRLVEIAEKCRTASIGCVECKTLLAQAINSTLKSFREKQASLVNNPRYIEDILAEGAERARIIASETLREVKQRMGLI